MRIPTTLPDVARPIAAMAAVLLTLALVAAPVAAKELEEARLDAPIPMGLPGGTEILVGTTVTVASPDGPLAVEGTPVYLRLTGPDGATTRAAGAADRIAGHYTFRIAIPAGGARAIEIGIHGSSDLPIMLAGDDPFTFGGITPGTAQLAPPPAAALTPLPRVAAPAPAVPAPAAEPAPASAPITIWVAVGLAALAAALAVVVAARTLRARRPPVARDAA